MERSRTREVGHVPRDGTGDDQRPGGGAPSGGQRQGPKASRRPAGSAPPPARGARRPPSLAGLSPARRARADRTARGGVRTMGWLAFAAALVFIVLACYVAVWFGHDSRDGQDWQ